MQYRQDRYGNRISILGYGCMRFTQSLGRIDLDKAEKELLAAIRAGVNYFDTAYAYSGSEAALGEILHRSGLRGEVRIATKLPHYLIRSREGLEKLFQEQLKRLRTDYVDYYLMHMLSGVDTWERLKSLGMEEWLAEKKRSGAIRQTGFSYHGSADMFCRLLDAYDWDLCQIQYNYMDEHAQAGKRGLHYAHEKGLPVIVMGPLRGGRLVERLPQAAKDIFESHPVRHSPAQWALRWLWNQPEVTCVLSGMNSVEMVEDNVKTASEAAVGALDAADENMLRQVVRAINAGMKANCTGCGYCMPCPANVDIPGAFTAWNRRYAEGKYAAFREYMMCTAMRRTSAAASNCVGCGKCEAHCPQAIPIRESLREVKRELEGPLYKIIRKGVEVFKVF